VPPDSARRKQKKQLTLFQKNVKKRRRETAYGQIFFSSVVATPSKKKITASCSKIDGILRRVVAEREMKSFRN